MSLISSFSKVQVGWIGLGNMGKLMAINLANALNAEGAPKLKVWNRTSSKSEEVVKETNGSAEKTLEKIEP